MNLIVPDLSLVVLIGTSGSGKSTFARKHFLPTEVLSSDFCRGIVADDENDQSATKEAFAVLHYLTATRLARGRLTVVDATNVQADARRPLIELARRHHVIPVAIVLNVPENICQERNRARPDRSFGPHVVRNQARDLKRSLRGLEKEGFRYVHVLGGERAIDDARIERQPLWNNRQTDHGPFDIIGDIHGCIDELRMILDKLGYGSGQTPPGRKAIFVGDLVDRGPDSPAVLKLVMEMTEAGQALCVPGNHDVKLLKKLRGRDVSITHGLAETLEQLDREAPEFKARAAAFIDGLVSHYVLDAGKLVVAHAGLIESMHGRASGKVRDFALFGDPTGERDEYGLPIRRNWAAEYKGRAMVVYGHTPVAEPEWLNNTINIDTGCVFGGRLTALRYPERELIQVEAKREYCTPPRPIGRPATILSTQQEVDETLDLSDVSGKRIIETRLGRSVTIRPENAAAALEAISRFAVNPKWLIYLPPTMSPAETSGLDGYLEHPGEAFAYFAREGVADVICEQKHMGSRAVVILCRDEDEARKRFGVADAGLGVIYTRTGRRFFGDPATETAVLDRLRTAATNAALWDDLRTAWVCLDCELMPWSAKAQDLLRRQYAPAGAAALSSLSEAASALENAPGGSQLAAHFRERARLAALYVEAYRRYCWTVNSITDLKLAPFHLLASEGAVHSDRDHTWHMEMLTRLAQSDPGLLIATPWKRVTLSDDASCADATLWWEDLTSGGGEGMVVKPVSFVVRGAKGLVQPAIKVRGREYLRIIYGPEYTTPANLARLRQRAVASKRSLAAREFALGVESLERFVKREPLRRVHECVFGTLALESEPIDPRL